MCGGKLANWGPAEPGCGGGWAWGCRGAGAETSGTAFVVGEAGDGALVFMKSERTSTLGSIFAPAAGVPGVDGAGVDAAVETVEADADEAPGLPFAAAPLGFAGVWGSGGAAEDGVAGVTGMEPNDWTFVAVVEMGGAGGAAGDDESVAEGSSNDPNTTCDVGREAGAPAPAPGRTATPSLRALAAGAGVKRPLGFRWCWGVAGDCGRGEEDEAAAFWGGPRAQAETVGNVVFGVVAEAGLLIDCGI